VTGVVEQGHKSKLQVELAGRVVDSVHLDRSVANLLGQKLDASQRIDQEAGAQPAALGTTSNCESPQQDDRDVDQRQPFGLIVW
jgi:hypothetical protein